MKKILFILLSVFVMTGCTTDFWDEVVSTVNSNQGGGTPPPGGPGGMMPDGNEMYTEDSIEIVDFVPALQPFVNEGCNTAWDNVSGIVRPDGSMIYFMNLPDWTPDSLDYDKDRFMFIFQVRNPYYGVYPGEAPYKQIASAGWLTMPVDDYGTLTCKGIQEVRTWVMDKVTGRWYMNSQICWAAVLCNGQTPCPDIGYGVEDVEYTPYEFGYFHLMEGSISNY